MQKFRIFNGLSYHARQIRKIPRLVEILNKPLFFSATVQMNEISFRIVDTLETDRKINENFHVSLNNTIHNNMHC